LNNIFSIAHVPSGGRDSIISIILWTRLLKEDHTILLPTSQLDAFELPIKPQILTHKDQPPVVKVLLLMTIYRGKVYE